jgi:hypothetical protein
MDAGSVATEVLKVLWPILGVLATGLLALLTFIGKRILNKFDDMCKTINVMLADNATTKARVAVIETRCDIFHRPKVLHE